MPLIPKEKLRAPNGSYVTVALFWELRRDPKYAFFTLSEWTENPEGLELVSFRKLYLEYCVDDPSEYTFATEVFGSWHQWSRICNNKLMLPVLRELRLERDVAIESLAVKSIVEEALDGRSRFQASKFLVAKGYITGEELTKKREKHSEGYTDINDDYKRLMNGD